MNKKYFALHLLPSRPDFAQTMSAEERGVMEQHVQYWMKFLNEGLAVVFGPVLHPDGAYGLGIVGVDDEEQVKELIKNDPAAAINKYVYYPMMAIVKQ